eukprot:GEMP01010068.1.p1 GENE.GEMP01010068.1~~GEMP01010068.1.p1  ORF type:complete len:376 (+),score=52.66 GEMP01010068.1:43-1170(+)
MELDAEAHLKWASEHWAKLEKCVGGPERKIDKAQIDSTTFRNALKEAVSSACDIDDLEEPNSRCIRRADRARDFIRRKADINDDGMVSFDEFEKFTYKLRCHGFNERGDGVMSGTLLWAESLFALFDLDGDGHLERHEFQEVHRFFHGANYSEEDIANEWRSLEMGSRTKVNKRCFIKWLIQGERGRALEERPPPDMTMEKSRSVPALDYENRPQTGPARFGSPMQLSGTSKHQWEVKSTDLMLPWNRQHHIVAKNDLKPRATRAYFSRPQSEEELNRHYRAYPQFRSQLFRLENVPNIKRPRMVLSHETSPPSLPRRHCISGLKLKNGQSLPFWTDMWQPPASEVYSKASLRPGSRSLRVGKLDPLPKFDAAND